MSEQKDYVLMGKELRAKISSVISAYQEVLGDIVEAEKSKVAAKKDYQSCLDRGDELGLSACLMRVREANHKIEGGPDSRNEFQSKVSDLEDEYKALRPIDRQHVLAAEATFEKAKEDLKKVKERSASISPGLQFELNVLIKLVADS